MKTTILFVLALSLTLGLSAEAKSKTKSKNKTKRTAASVEAEYPKRECKPGYDESRPLNDRGPITHYHLWITDQVTYPNGVEKGISFYHYREGVEKKKFANIEACNSFIETLPQGGQRSCQETKEKVLSSFREFLLLDQDRGTYGFKVFPFGGSHSHVVQVIKKQNGDIKNYSGEELLKKVEPLFGPAADGAIPEGAAPINESQQECEFEYVKTYGSVQNP